MLAWPALIAFVMTQCTELFLLSMQMIVHVASPAYGSLSQGGVNITSTGCISSLLLPQPLLIHSISPYVLPETYKVTINFFFFVIWQ